MIGLDMLWLYRKYKLAKIAFSCWKLAQKSYNLVISYFGWPRSHSMGMTCFLLLKITSVNIICCQFWTVWSLSDGYVGPKIAWNIKDYPKILIIQLLHAFVGQGLFPKWLQFVTKRWEPHLGSAFDRFWVTLSNLGRQLIRYSPFLSKMSLKSLFFS